MSGQSANISIGNRRLLRREKAAAYLSVSPNTFDKLVKDGTAPKPKLLSSIKVWDRNDLDALADDLPHEGQSNDDFGWDEDDAA